MVFRFPVWAQKYPLKSNKSSMIIMKIFCNRIFPCLKWVTSFTCLGKKAQFWSRYVQVRCLCGIIKSEWDDWSLTGDDIEGSRKQIDPLIIILLTCRLNDEDDREIICTQQSTFNRLVMRKFVSHRSRVRSKDVARPRIQGQLSG